MIDSKPHKIRAEIDNAFTTFTLKTSAYAVHEFTNFNRKPGEGLCQFFLLEEGARKILKDVYGHITVSDHEMTSKLEAALSGEIKTLFYTWCGLKGATYKLLRQKTVGQNR